MRVLEGLMPELVWKYFEDISMIPRGSGNESQIADFLENFAKEKDLWYRRDDHNNILIRKGASEGYENAEGVILQGHMDMVCEKASGYNHDFLNDPLKLIVDGDFITADRTTLGADNGIAVAMCLAVLSDESIEHPEIEVLLTSDEEMGMTGAINFDYSDLKGRRLINLDSEEEGVVVVSCAGGMRAELLLDAERKEYNGKGNVYQIMISGLKGGHSGADIHLQRANAIKLSARVLKEIEGLCSLCEITGGNKENAIPREAKIIICTDNIDRVNEKLKNIENILNREYYGIEDGINIKAENIDIEINSILSEKTYKDITDMLLLIPCGVITMSADMEGIVESSSSIGVIRTYEDKISVISAPRSSVISRRDYIELQFRAIASAIGCKLNVRGKYPAWEYRKDSPLRDAVVESYEEMFGKKPKIEAIHAGLECGTFAEKVPSMDMVSIGPEMYDVHTTEERISISSSNRVYNYLLDILKKLK